ncbi:hypothetical protein ACXWTF_13070 [Thiomicrolovo sp. ZZH C-3]
MTMTSGHENGLVTPMYFWQSVAILLILCFGDGYLLFFSEIDIVITFGAIMVAIFVIQFMYHTIRPEIYAFDDRLDAMIDRLNRKYTLQGFKPTKKGDEAIRELALEDQDTLRSLFAERRRIFWLIVMHSVGMGLCIALMAYALYVAVSTGGLGQ